MSSINNWQSQLSTPTPINDIGRINDTESNNQTMSIFNVNSNNLNTDNKQQFNTSQHNTLNYHHCTCNPTTDFPNTLTPSIPSSHLPVQHSDHPCNHNISNRDTNHIQQTFQNAIISPDSPIVTVIGNSLPLLNQSSFHDLFCHGSPINDSVIHSFLSLLHNMDNTIHSADTNFGRYLFHYGWIFFINIALNTPNAWETNQHWKPHPFFSQSMYTVPIG